MAKIINVTPHALNFRNSDGTEFVVEPSGVVVNATPTDEVVGTHPSGAELVQVRFEASAEAIETIARLEAENPGAVIVGSMIAAQAFPNRVFGMVAAAGFERRPPAEKRMRPDRFTTY